jgi:hypothetical protein
LLTTTKVGDKLSVEGKLPPGLVIKNNKVMLKKAIPLIKFLKRQELMPSPCASASLDVARPSISVRGSPSTLAVMLNCEVDRGEISASTGAWNSKELSVAN